MHPSIQAAAALAKSGLDKKELGNLWAIADADKDGQLSGQEFAVAMHLASCSTAKHLPLPAVLPECLANIVGTGHKEGRENSGMGKNKSKKSSGPKASGSAKMSSSSVGDGTTNEDSAQKTGKPALRKNVLPSFGCTKTQTATAQATQKTTKIIGRYRS